jgi:4-amino-4-deoxy-L-arabinose transferase-like glycosyltransferase
LGVTAALYLWGVGSQGWANSFYAAAVQAGTKSWKAFFFGSFDASNFITVDKPPASLWVMELSARIFGLNSWSLLVPQALEGVATVGLLYAAVKRWFGPAAGLIAGAVVALTPVAALMFRYDNPDALLVLLLTGAGYATTRALESGRTRWLVLAMSLVGTGFITKMLQAFLVLPAIAVVYLLAGPPKLGRRIGQLAIAAIALVVASGWWVTIVELTPARDRPYIGGSQNNNLFNLIFGYNGFGRITGNETGSAANQWGPTGWERMFLPSFGSQISWLIPAALVLLAATLWSCRGRSRTDRTRAAALLWGGWLLVTGLLLSYAKGIIHPYYTVALAPAIGAVIAIGAVSMWRKRDTWLGRGVLAAALGATTLWAYVLMGRASSWMPDLRVTVLVVGLGATAALLTTPLRLRRVALLVGGIALLVALAAPGAYTLDTVSVSHTGAIPSAGPTQAGSTGGPGGLAVGTGAAGGFPGGTNPAAGQHTVGGGVPGNAAIGGSGTLPAGTSAPSGPPTRLGRGAIAGTGSNARARAGAGAPPGGAGIGSTSGTAGGLLNASTPGAALTRLLEKDASRYTWIAATVGSNSAAGYQLATRDPVMAIGGFNGSDPTPRLAQFEKYVAEGKIHYFISGGGTGGGAVGGAGPSSSGTGSAITSWVEAHFKAVTVDGITIYDVATTTS